MKTGILFVCLGNICRSPQAEGVMRHLVEVKGLGDRFEIDSAGTGNWHVGNAPDQRAVETARNNGVDISGLKARQVRAEDFEKFDYVFAMDRDNLADMEQMASGAGLSPHLFLEFAGTNDLQDVPDPYFGGTGFADVYRLIEAGCSGILKHIQKESKT